MFTFTNTVKPKTDQSEFTRRIPALPKKQLAMDAKIARQLVRAWDVEKSREKLLDVWFRKAHLLSNPRYWELLRTVWVAGGATELADKFRPYFKSLRPCKGWFMTVEDATELEAMVFPMKLYRAYSEDPDPGISWTSDLDWCKRYAEVGGRKIKERIVRRDEVFAYITRRHESEFIILD